MVQMSKKPLQVQVDELTEKNATLLLRCERTEEAYELLKNQLLDFQRHRFGQRSERFIDNEFQQYLFSSEIAPLDEEIDPEDGEENGDAIGDIKKAKRKKKANRKFADHLPRIEVIIPVEEHDKTCICGCQKKLINHARHERLHYIPPVFEVHVELREVLACPKGCSGAIVTADKPKQILPKSRFTESMLAYLIVSKFDDRMPFYHLEKQLASRSGVPFSRQTMARAIINVTDPLMPLFNLLKDQIIDYDIGALDATGLQVLKEPGRDASKKSYVYCFRGGEPGKEAILYEYNAEKHKPFIDNWFSGFKGTLHCDADPFFELMFSREDINGCGCNSHARRYFEKVATATKREGLAKQAMRFYKRLYKIEKKAKDQQMTPEQRYDFRLKHSKPIMEEFKQWLDEHNPTVAPKTTLGKAFNYALKYWDRLCMFLTDGRLEIDNNLTEQEIKPLVMARKNFLFSDSIDGAKALCLHFSLIRTAKKHGLDPYHYYVKILDEIPHCHTVEDFEALLPWNIDLQKVGSLKAAA